jgi:calcium-dependent protein kinase
MLQVDHPNIVNFFEVYLDHKYIHLIMEHCTGGQLFDKLMEVGYFREDSARTIVR